jgi:hypothetical protein
MVGNGAKPNIWREKDNALVNCVRARESYKRPNKQTGKRSQNELVFDKQEKTKTNVGNSIHSTRSNSHKHTRALSRDCIPSSINEQVSSFGVVSDHTSQNKHGNLTADTGANNLLLHI